MNRLIALGVVAAVGGVITWRLLPQRSRSRPSAAPESWIAKRMLRHMERMMASLPENAPPKLVMSILPKLKAQNETIIALLREQNELLRQQRAALGKLPSTAGERSDGR